MNVILRGKVKEIVESMVDLGYANSQSEAIRMAILNFGQRTFGEEELRLVNKGVKAEMNEIRAGKLKTKSIGKLKEKYSL